LLLTNNVALDGRRLRVEKAKVNRTLFIAKMNRSLTNVVSSPHTTHTTHDTTNDTTHTIHTTHTRSTDP
jgi:hypothetical protein